MSLTTLYGLTGVILFCVGLYGLILHAHLMRKILALNIMSSGVSLLLVALAHRQPHGEPDPVPHAMVLTGVVVAVSATALALILVRRLYTATGQSDLSEDST
jgi:multicomponent Na+:H+ antiporter subunit C